MSVFFAKISKNDQIESMYSVSTLNFLNGLQINDYVFPKQNDLTVSKLFKVVSIINNGDVYRVDFKLICEFNPLSLNEFISFSWFKLNVNLLNKVFRSTKNIGYIKLELHNHTETEFENNFVQIINDSKNFRRIVVCDNENQFKESINVQLVKDDSTIICNFDSKFGMNMRENFDPSQYSIVNTFSGNNKYKGTKGNMFEFIEKYPLKGKEFNKLLGFYDLFYGNATTSTYLNSTETSDTLNDFNTDVDSNETNKIISNIGFPHQKIYYGAPGTGKSFILNFHKNLLTNNANCKRITFHPEYSNFDFFGGYKPISDATGKIFYEFVPGPFMELYVKAKNNKNEKFLLVIEEINRANAFSIFGDLFQLLDRKNGESEYPINVPNDCREYLKKQGIFDEVISLPSNLYIWATMNSADQGVFPLDTAFKRRWSFEYIGIDDGESNIESYSFKINSNIIKWNTLRRAINECLISFDVNEDKLMGPFFINLEQSKINDKAIINEIKNKVLMYLFEDAGRNIRSKIFNVRPVMLSSLMEKFEEEGLAVFDKLIIDAYNKLENE